MTEEITVELTRDPPLVEAAGSFVRSEVVTGVCGRTKALQRFTCGKGCGFVVNVN